MTFTGREKNGFFIQRGASIFTFQSVASFKKLSRKIQRRHFFVFKESRDRHNLSARDKDVSSFFPEKSEEGSDLGLKRQVLNTLSGRGAGRSNDFFLLFQVCLRQVRPFETGRETVAVGRSVGRSAGSERA